MQGLTADSGQSVCAEPDVFEYFPSTGYRRIPLTTCEGGRQLDMVGQPLPCPNKEDRYRKAHAASGVAIFFAVTIPLAVGAVAGYFVWQRWVRGGGSFGQIRLGEQGGAGGGGLGLDADAPYIRYPVVAISAVAAVVATLPLLAASLWRAGVGAVQRRAGGGGAGPRSWLGGAGGARSYTTRDSFARGRGEYAIVDEDEGELLGEDSDEEV